MKYIANPVEVDAHVIVSVNGFKGDGTMSLELTLANGDKVLATKQMISRYMPVSGDYWVIQSDGYIYLNPKDVFERKYSPAATLGFSQITESK